MFAKIEDRKLRQIIELFKKLDDTGQDCVLEQPDRPQKAPAGN
ncbi:hypothetical protein AGMMS50267_17520 [Spirochaetia bacterium]|nr:hypothetical protein AGMMS50267_17520 [Spirochaetia bacterium]